MSTGAIDRRKFDTLTPEFEVKINSSDLPVAAKADLIAISVVEEMNATGMFCFTLLSWDGAEMKVKWIDDDLFKEGNVIDIKMGYRDQLETLFSGEITGLEPEFTNQQPPTLTVRGYDRRHRLMRKPKTQSFLNMKDSEIASQIAGNAGLRTDIKSTDVTLAYVLQHNQTDMEFLRQRAQRIGYEVGVNDQTLYFRPRTDNGKEVLTLNREVELLEFYPHLTTVGQLEDVSVLGWNPKQKKEVVGSSKIGDESNLAQSPVTGPAATRKAFPGASGGLSVNLAISEQAQADKVASGWFKEMALHYVVGDGVCIGRAEIRPGALIRIEGLGRRFSGCYYVTGTEHTYRPNLGYRTAFSVMRDAT